MQICSFRNVVTHHVVPSSQGLEAKSCDFKAQIFRSEKVEAIACRLLLLLG